MEFWRPGGCPPRPVVRRSRVARVGAAAEAGVEPALERPLREARTGVTGVTGVGRVSVVVRACGVRATAVAVAVRLRAEARAEATDTGAKVARGMRGQRREHLSRALADFSVEERAELARLLAKLADSWPRHH